MDKKKQSPVLENEIKIQALAQELGGKKLCNIVQQGGIDQWKAEDFLRRMYLLLQDDSYRHHFFREIDEKTVQTWLHRLPVNNTLFKTLYEKRWLPLPETIKAIGRKEDLTSLLDSMHHGNFDPENKLHLELEYSWLNFSFGGYSNIPKSQQPSSFETFKKIPPLPLHRVYLSGRDNEHIDASAREAVEVFKIIRQRQEEEAEPLLVIGNKRYGKNFVVEPLEEHLQRLGCHIVYEYVRSTDCDEYTVPQLSRDTKNKIITEKPPVVIVDGTAQPKRYDEYQTILARFPAAIKGYINALQNITPALYNFSFWAPQINPHRFYLNDKLYDQEPARGKKMALFISSTTVEEEGGSNGTFDDADSFIHERRLVFTQRGIDYRKIAPSEMDFVTVIQEKMKERIMEYL